MGLTESNLLPRMKAPDENKTSGEETVEELTKTTNEETENNDEQDRAVCLSGESDLVNLYEISTANDMAKIHPTTSVDTTKWKVDDLCLAPFTDGLWYYAKIVEIQGDKCVVLYTDYDDQAEVEIDELCTEADMKERREKNANKAANAKQPSNDLPKSGERLPISKEQQPQNSYGQKHHEKPQEKERPIEEVLVEKLNLCEKEAVPVRSNTRKIYYLRRDFFRVFNTRSEREWREYAQKNLVFFSHDCISGVSYTHPEIVKLSGILMQVADKVRQTQDVETSEQTSQVASHSQNSSEQARQVTSQVDTRPKQVPPTQQVRQPQNEDYVSRFGDFNTIEEFRAIHAKLLDEARKKGLDVQPMGHPIVPPRPTADQSEFETNLMATYRRVALQDKKPE